MPIQGSSQLDGRCKATVCKNRLSNYCAIEGSCREVVALSVEVDCEHISHGELLVPGATENICRSIATCGEAMAVRNADTDG